jgi:tricorn protease
MLTPPAWSPDGARLAVADKDGKLYVVTVAGKKVVEIADDAFGGIFDYAWSPDGGHLAFSMAEHTGVRVLHVWSVADGKLRRVTSEMFSSFAPPGIRRGRSSGSSRTASSRRRSPTSSGTTPAAAAPASSASR